MDYPINLITQNAMGFPRSNVRVQGRQNKQPTWSLGEL